MKTKRQILERVSTLININHEDDEEFVIWEEEFLDLCTELHRFDINKKSDIYEILENCLDILVHGPEDDSEGLYNMIEIIINKELDTSKVWDIAIKKAIIKYNFSKHRFLFLFHNIKFNNSYQKEQIKSLFNELDENTKSNLVFIFTDYNNLLPELGYSEYSKELIEMLSIP
ncbi:MAG: hypothetical protein U5M51_07975 [Emticicia sp.]|nr:hypothetical protein [Emticicia sp.]